MGPSRKSVARATTHASKAKSAERSSDLYMKNANGITRSRRIAVRALAINARAKMVARSWSCFAPTLYVACEDVWNCFPLAQPALRPQSSEVLVTLTLKVRKHMLFE